MMKKLLPKGLLSRFLSALLLTAACYNPSGYSFFHWIGRENDTGLLPLQVLIGSLLLLGVLIYLMATYRALGTLGSALTIALFAALAWVLVSAGLLSLETPAVLGWAVLVVLSATLTLGLYWARLWKRLTGQVTVQDVNSLGVD